VLNIKRAQNEQLGFSLLEVLITIVIATVGLIGVAGMQVASIKMADVSNTRTIGAAHVSQIYERMAGNTTALTTYQVAYGGGGSIPDVQNWKQALAATLPNGDGAITVVETGTGCVPPPTGSEVVGCSLVTVTVRWREFRGAQEGNVTERNVEFTSTARI
jgi:type IV pilus assembly protein PilV